MKTALVAGTGDLPLVLWRALKARGNEPAVYLIDQESQARWSTAGASVKVVENPLAFGFLLGGMKLRGIKGLILAGGVPKKLMFRRDQMDEQAYETVRASDGSDHGLLDSVVRTVERFGIAVLSYQDLIPELMAPRGLIAGREPTDDERADFRAGWRVLQALLPFSFGQGLTVKDRSVVAVEAMEGTDGMIRRTGELVGGGVLVKALRGDQDRRFDLPVVGLTTLETMVRAGMTALFVQAGSTLLLDRPSLHAFALERGLALWGF